MSSYYHTARNLPKVSERDSDGYVMVEFTDDASHACVVMTSEVADALVVALTENTGERQMK